MNSPFLTTIDLKNTGTPPVDLPDDQNEIEEKPIIRIKDLSVIYFAGKNNESRALDGINLEIYSGEYIIFFGPSGSGKSTLLNIIAGLEIPTVGKIFVDGQNLAHLSSNDLNNFHRKKTGMVFQTYNLIPSLSVLDNVILPQIFKRVRSQERKKNGRILLKKFNVDSFENRLPQDLSGGQQQRVGIARALINDPPILLSDEATGNLDSEAAQNVLEIFNSLNLHEKKTVVAVTHNPEQLFYADRIVYMKDGKIIKIEINEQRKIIRGENEYGGIKKERTELDLLLQAYPDLSSMQLQVMMAPFKAKMLVAYLLSNFDYREIEIMEAAVTRRLLKTISQEELFEIFDSSIESGGVGLNKNTALKFSALVEEVAVKADFIQEEAYGVRENKKSSFERTIDEVRKSLLEEYNGELSLSQVAALNKGIEYRLLSKIGKNEFQEYLDRPFENGGVGMNKRSARNISRKFEVMMLLKFGR